MTTAELKLLLDEYRDSKDNRYLDIFGNECRKDGFNLAVDLLMPCLEALDFYSQNRGLKIDLKTNVLLNSDNSKYFHGSRARQALEDLKHKLKEGK